MAEAAKWQAFNELKAQMEELTGRPLPGSDFRILRAMLRSSREEVALVKSGAIDVDDLPGRCWAFAAGTYNRLEEKNG